MPPVHPRGILLADEAALGEADPVQLGGIAFEPEDVAELGAAFADAEAQAMLEPACCRFASRREPAPAERCSAGQATPVAAVLRPMHGERVIARDRDRPAQAIDRQPLDQSSAAAASQSSSRSSPSAQTKKSNRHLPCGSAGRPRPAAVPRHVAGDQPLQEAAHVLAREADDGAVGRVVAAMGLQLGSAAVASQTLTIRRPDDWHVHLRDGDDAAGGRALHRAAVRARDRHAEPRAAGHHARGGRGLSRAHHRGGGPGFTPLMTCYLTDDADPDEIARGFDDGRVDRRQALSGRRDDQQRPAA